jgi:hypothetical protein
LELKNSSKDTPVEFTEVELYSLRKRMYEEINKIPELRDNGWAPEAKHFEIVKKQLLSDIAYQIWEKEGRPKNRDINIWIQAEETWNYIRFGWI